MLATPPPVASTDKDLRPPNFSADAIDVLLVEDDRDAGQTLKRILEWHDVRVVHVTTGQQGIESFDSAVFDVVVTDVLLGDMTGVDVLRAIRAKEESFPVILLTGHDSIASAIDALRLGAQDYIRKPLERIEDLITPIQIAVTHHKLVCASKALDDKLRVSEARFRSLAELLPETVFEADREGRVLFLNRSGMERFGITEEMLRKGFYLPQGVSPEDAARVASTLMRVLDGEPASGVEFIGQHQSGVTFPILTFSTPMYQDGVVTGVRSIVVDISRQKEFENELLHYQEALHKMDSQLQVTEERERCKLAQDLHDSVAQLLVAARIQISLCARGQDDAGRSRRLERANEIITEALQQTRSLVFQLSPPSLYTNGLQAGLEDLAGHMLPMHGLNVTFNKCEDPVCLDEKTLTHVFRAARELLVNAAKHSGADECVVTVSQQRDSVCVTVEDHGSGFDVALESQRNTEGGFGLFSTRERLKAINGSLVLQSEPGKGTKAIVSVPI